MLVKFAVDFYPDLVASRECNPIFHAYLTSDVRATPGEVWVSDRYHERVAAMKSCKTTQKLTKTSKRYSFVIECKIADDAKITSDSYLCFQVYSEIFCPPGDWGLHTCGWAAIRLIKFVMHPEAVLEAPLCDQGDSPVGSRGRVSVRLASDKSVITVAAAAAKSHLSGGVEEDIMIGKPHTVLPQFQNMIGNMTERTSSRIMTIEQPPYISCGNRLYRPACSYLFTEPSRMPEEFYLSAFDAVIKRRHRLADNNNKTINVELLTSMTFNERGGLLMDIATYVPTACTYLFDETKDDAGSSHQLILSEDFSRGLCHMLTDDCEGMCFGALMFLDDLMTHGTWNTWPIAQLQQIRMQYVAMLVLKAVENSSASQAYTHIGRSRNRGFAAHNTCDLVPLATLIDVHPAFAELARVRRIDVRASAKSTVIIGEGTIRLIEYPPNWREVERNEGMSTTGPSLSTKSAVLKLFEPRHSANSPLIGTPDWEGSHYYRYTLMAVVHDTYIHYRSTETWPCPYLKFLTKKTGTMGVKHIPYARCEWTTTADMVVTPLSSDIDRDAYRELVRSERFEHPLISITEPGTNDDMLFNEYATRIKAAVHRMNKRLRNRRASKTSHSKYYEEVYTPLTVFDEASVASLEHTFYERLENPDSPISRVVKIKLVFERIADAMVSVSFIFIF
jgi:hypothetical protein